MKTAYCFAALLSLATAFAGCGGGLPAPTELDARRVGDRWPRLSTRDLEHGRSLYAMRCARCHELYEPAAFPAPAWETAVHEMRERAHVSESEALFIVQYLVSVAGREERRAAPVRPSLL